MAPRLEDESRYTSHHPSAYAKPQPIPPQAIVGHSAPTTFFLRSEADMEKSYSSSSGNTVRDSTYGVQSLEDALGAAFGDNSKLDPDTAGGETLKGSILGKKRKVVDVKEGMFRLAEVPSDTSSRNASPHFTRRPSHTTLSTPLTPSNANSPVPDSALPSTPRSVSLRSFRLSDEEAAMSDVASQAIASSEDEADNAENDEEEEKQAEAAPQLVMPSITMPSRRPFTSRGQRLGKLKIMVAGRAGVGKSSLVKAVLQHCDDIVHVDTPVSAPAMSSSPRAARSKARGKHAEASVPTETYASTRPYPAWWSGSEDNGTSHRRKSSEDVILERNICLVDTPACRMSSSGAGDQTIQYIERQLHKNAPITAMSEADLLSLFSGSGGAQVDLILYMLSHDPPSDDELNYISRLSSLTNVVLLVGKSDKLSAHDLHAFKTNVFEHLLKASVRPFMFGKSLEDILFAQSLLPISPSLPASSSQLTEIGTALNTPLPPYAVSSLPGADNEMDASLLMSSDYIQPLIESELDHLIEKVFEPENAAWLRHLAAKKFLQWRAARPPTLYSAMSATKDELAMHNYLHQHSHAIATPPSLSPITSPPSSLLSSPSLSPSPANLLIPRPTSSFALARLRDQHLYQQRQENLHIAKWATDLHRSLRNERERYELLQVGDREQCLLNSIEEDASCTNTKEQCWEIAKLDALPSHRKPHRSRSSALRRHLNTHDPLGLCALGDSFGRSSWTTLKVFGGFGIAGAIMVVCCRAWNVDPWWWVQQQWSWWTQGQTHASGWQSSQAATGPEGGNGYGWSLWRDW